MQQVMTQPTRQSDIKRTWHLLNARGQVLGRLSSEIAGLLMGKAKPYFVRNLDCGDYVVVINAKEITVTGRKADQKVYYRHSMYPGGFRAEVYKDLLLRRPEDIIIHAVKGMLPQNKLRASMLKRLSVFIDEKHPFENK